MRRTIRHLPVLTASAAVALGAVSPAVADADRTRTEGELVRYSSRVPAGASARVQAVYNAAGDTIVTLHVRGLVPHTEYGAHAHTFACGATGSAAGPHFQHVVDPVQPSTNPAYANDVNEIWLDFVTDADGDAVAQTKVPWQFSPERRAGSVIIHHEHTHTGPTDSGTAGPRLACLTVGF